MGARLAIAIWLCALVATARAARPHLQDSKQKIVSSPSRQHAHVFLDEQSKLRVELNQAGVGGGRASIAWSEYTPQSASKSNFGRLRLESSGEYPDDVQMRALGYLEGFLTAEPIWQHWLNMDWYLSVSTTKYDKLRRWLDKQREYMAVQIKARAGEPFWDMQALIWAQLEGLVDGYNEAVSSQEQQQQDTHTHATSREAITSSSGSTGHVGKRGGSGGGGKTKGDEGTQPQPLTLSDLMLLNSFGDMDDLLNIIEQDWIPDTDTHTDTHTDTQLGASKAHASKPAGPILHPRWHTLSPGEAKAKIATSGHCSALIKVTSDLSDILMGHTTWWSYSSLLRLYKHVITHLSHPAVAAQKLSFSSYPGLIHSLDDFMIADSGLVMMETSNDIYDFAAYALSTNQGALSWQRARAAIMLATDGPSFAQLIQMHNSGTYNNQYMIVDLERFIPGQRLQSGLLTVVETVPGGAYVADTTQELERGYWPSYNIPYFEEAYNSTGVPDLVDTFNKRGGAFKALATGLSYQVSPRAKIFRRDSGTVNSLSDLKRVLRSNGWSAGKNSDPFSPSPYDAICARGDLDPSHPSASGCYDAKVTSYQLAINMASEAVNGPAWDGDGSGNGHPAFDWRDWKDVAHIGMVTQYRTTFELQAP